MVDNNQEPRISSWSLGGGLRHALHPPSRSKASHYNGNTCYGHGCSDWKEHLVEEVGNGECRGSFLCGRTFEIEVRHHFVYIQSTERERGGVVGIWRKRVQCQRSKQKHFLINISWTAQYRFIL